MSYQKSDYPGLFPFPAALWFVAGFVVVAVLVARFRPAWLPQTWLAAWLLGVSGTLLSLHPSWLRYAPVATVAEIVFAIAVPTALTTLWLHRSRGHAFLSRAGVQLVSALAAFVCGLMIVATIVGLVGEAAR